MKTIIIREPGIVDVAEKNSLTLNNNEVLIKTCYVGFCGSDLATYLGNNPMVSFPRVPGHEISGMIEKLGNDVPENFVIGDLVTVVPYTSCGICSSCRNERANACKFNQTLGVQRDGAMQEYIAVPWQKLIQATKLNMVELSIVEPLTVGFHAIARGRVTDADTVMVLGCGMIGAGAIIRASILGARVIAVDIDDVKLNIAKQLGAHHVINSVKQDLHKELSILTENDGPDVVVEAAGNPVTYRSSVSEVAFSGRIVLIGYVAKEVEFITKLIVQKELDILGSRNATPEDFRAVISYLERGTLPTDLLISRIVKPEEVGKILKLWAADPGKIMKILIDFN